MVTVKFYYNKEGEIEGVYITKLKKGTPVEYLTKIIDCLENEFPNLVKTDGIYKVKLKERYERDGAGVERFDGYDIKSIRLCTRIL